MNKWDERFLNLAQEIAGWSKDPSTQVGAVFVRPDRTIASIGFNGFPRGIADRSDRLSNKEFKHAVVIHAEENAILNAREPLSRTAVYVWPIIPCPRCASKLIQVGVRIVIAPMTPREKVGGLNLDLTRELLREARIDLFELEQPPVRMAKREALPV